MTSAALIAFFVWYPLTWDPNIDVLDHNKNITIFFIGTHEPMYEFYLDAEEDDCCELFDDMEDNEEIYERYCRGSRFTDEALDLIGDVEPETDEADIKSMQEAENRST
jgi:hypothetical protein